MKVNWVKLAVSILITEGAGGIGSVFTYNAIPTWYAALNKTPITPPNWIFAPMWISLFFLMGLSLYLIWNRGNVLSEHRLAISLFFVQLALNVLWSFVFFGQKELLLGGIEIVFLWYFILATIIEFMRIDRGSGYLLFPYISWVTVATILNFSILWANA